MNTLSGGCHCGNISFQMELSRSPGAYKPRACDCTFCSKHGAAYVSDPHGSLSIHINAAGDSRFYRQGSGTAECLLCANCGVLVGAVYRESGRVYGTVNAKAVGGLPEAFGTKEPVSPQTLSPADKTKRWQDIWFPNVAVTYGKA